MANLHREREFSIFTATMGHIYIFLVKKAVGNARKSMVESLTNVMAVKHECYLLSPEMFYIRLSMMVFDSALPEDTPSGFIYSTVTGAICSRASLTSLFYHK